MGRSGDFGQARLCSAAPLRVHSLSAAAAGLPGKSAL